MAVHVFKNAYVYINSVDLSDHCREVTIDDGINELDTTVMSNAAENVDAGLRKWTITVKLLQDYAAGKTHHTLHPLVGTKTSITVRPDAGVVAPANPQWTSTAAFLPEYSPIGAAAGDKMEVTVKFRNGGAILAYTEA